MNEKVSTRLGKVSVTPKSTWYSTVEYERLDVVNHNGSGYVAITDNIGCSPDEHPDKWLRVVDKGDKGDKGMCVFVRYSASPDGTDFTADWTTGQNYIGVAVADDEPLAKGAYVWTRIGDLVNVAQSRGSSSTDAISQKAFTDEMVKCDGRASAAEKRIENVEAALIGDNVTPTVDSSVAYAKAVPAGALPNAAITEIGGMSYKCENLIKFPYVNMTNALNGVTFTWNGDGTITANGTATEFMAIVLFRSDKFNVTRGALSGCPKSISGISLGIYDYDISEYIVRDYGNGAVFDITATNIAVALLISGGTVLNNAIFAPMLNKGDTAKPYQPFFTGLRDSKVQSVESVGANLIPFPYTSPTTTMNGVTWAVNGDGSITATGTATGYSYFTLAENVPISKNVVCISPNGVNTSNIRMVFRLRDANGNSLLEQNVYNYEKINIADYPTATTFSAYLIRDNETAVSGTFFPMLNKGDTALPYSSYFKNTFAIPEAVQAIDGYGQGVNEQYYNKIVLNPAESVKKFVKAVGCVDMGDLTYIYVTNMGAPYFQADVSGMTSELKSAALKCDKYDVHFVATDLMNDKTIRGGNGYPWVYIKDNAYTDGAELKAALAGTKLLYELATPTETDLSAYFTDDNLIGVEAGGTVTAVNEHEQAVPYSIEYTVKGV